MKFESPRKRSAKFPAFLKRMWIAPAVFATALGCASLDEAFAPPPAQLQAAALQAWSGIKKQEKISTDPRYTRRMQRVAPRVIRAAGGNPAEWEVRVFQSDQLNAFALPGGKIGFYTGILDLMDNDDQIAAVMGHEVAHVERQHAAKRAGRAMQTQLGLGVAGAAIGARGGNQDAWLQVLGLGAQIGSTLPFSRGHELEADTIGLRYMMRAGYDPNEAVRFWEKMEASKSGAPPEFLSTHPGGQTRIRQLREEIAILQGRGAGS